MNSNETIRPMFPFFPFQNLPFLPKMDGGEASSGSPSPAGLTVNPFLGKGTFPSPVSSPPSPKQAESLDLSKKVHYDINVFQNKIKNILNLNTFKF